MPQQMVGQHAGHHRLAHRHGADADAGIVAALGDDLGLVAVAVDGPARGQDRGGRLDREPDHHVLAGADPAQDAAGMVGEEARAVIAHADLVGVVLAAQRRRGEAGADLHALDRVDRHHRLGEVGIELVVDRLAQPRRHAAKPRPRSPRPIDEPALRISSELRLPARGRRGIRAPERVALDLGQGPSDRDRWNPTPI